MAETATNKLVDHFFRHESGQLVAVLARFFGLQHFDLVEDMVQSALVDALRVWKTKGVPDEPTAWIHRVAKNKVLDSLRRDANFRRKAGEFAVRELDSEHRSLDELFDESQLQDNLLRLIFACCHPTLPADSAIPLTLKTVCGFSEQETARSLLLTPETVRKRIYRAKKAMVEQHISLELPPAEKLTDRLNNVHNVLYLMFNEGYCSAHSDHAIRLDVCEEAARLCYLLAEHPHCRTKPTLALLALMLFHACRFQSRIDQEGSLVLLEDQDRQLWDRRLLERALEIFHEASVDCQPTSYHCEAAIAMYHCKAERFQDTNWSAIIELYERLIITHPSPIYRLNRAIAVGQRDGPAMAISLLDEIKLEPRLANFHLLDATYGELYRLDGDRKKALQYFQSAIEKAESPHDKKLLQRRIQQCLS